MPFWRECHHVPDGGGGEALIHCGMLPGARRRGTIRDVKAAMTEKTRGTELIVAGDLIVELVKTGSRGKEEEITAAVATAGLEDMAGHHFFLSRRAWCQDWRTCSMRRQGRVVRSRTDYILGSDCRIFQNLDV